MAFEPVYDVDPSHDSKKGQILSKADPCRISRMVYLVA
jgi:hypothetical protein